MDRITILTPENVEIEYPIAGLGSRFYAVLIDHLLQGGISAILFIIFLISNPNFNSNDLIDLFRNVFNAILILLTFITYFGYFIFFETIWSGLTPGKKIAQIQVIKDSGEPIRFIDAFIRNILRPIDFLPFYYLAGVLCIIFHKQNKRIGDMVARTLVIKNRDDLTPVTLPDIVVESDIEIDSTKITAEEYNLLRDFLIRRENLLLPSRKMIAEKLCKRIAVKMELDYKKLDSEEFIEVAALEYKKNIRSL
jgi:uncharacterized RDD family membrane protein YckC